MIETGAGIYVYKYEVEKIKQFLFIDLHICFYLHEVENIHQYVLTKKYLKVETF